MTDNIVDWLRDLGDRAAFEPSAHHKAADEIERLRAALEKIMQKCPYARRDKWCACIDCNCIIARAALEGGEGQ
jgi:hypothetical protein